MSPRRTCCRLLLVLVVAALVAAQFLADSHQWKEVKVEPEPKVVHVEPVSMQNKKVHASSEGAVLTIFSILRDMKPFNTSEELEPETQTEWMELLHTHNAIGSWLRLDKVDVLLFGVEESCRHIEALLADAPKPYSCLPIPCVDEVYKTPRYDCLFSSAASMGTTEFVMYANSDIVFFPDLLNALDFVAPRVEDFLVVGERRDVLFPHKLQFDSPTWAQDFRTLAMDIGKDHGNTGIDYFLYPRRYSRPLPPFLVGRIRWDNWLLAEYIGNRNAAAIDGSKVILAVHLNHMKIGNSHLRIGTDYNEEISRGFAVDPKKIGHIGSCDLLLLPDKKSGVLSKRGSCPACSIAKNAQSLDTMLYKQGEQGSVIVATVDAGYIDFALNWACSLKRLGINNYLFHATDDTVFQQLQDLDMPAIKYLSQMSIDYEASGAADRVVYGSVSYQSIMNSRTEFISKIVQKGYDVLLSDIDIVFLRNPFLFFQEDLDIQGAAHKETKISGGFIFTRSSPQSFRIWSKVLGRHKKIFSKIQSSSSFNIHSNTEQELLNTALLGSEDGDIKWGRIPQHVVADGNQFFITKATQMNGDWPAVIHNNYAIGEESKKQRFVNTSLWLLDDDLRCRGFQTALPPPVTKEATLIIKIITFARPKALHRLLDSLTKATIPKGQMIKLEFFIDHPTKADAADVELMKDRQACIDAANSYPWKHGKKSVVIRTVHHGLTGQWLNAWFPTDMSEVALILEDDNIVSPVFFLWLQEALEAYFHNPDHHDPRLYGIALQNQHFIAGRYSKKPVELLKPEVHFYKYQLLSTWGPVFFASHWSNFVSWYADRSSNPKFFPMFSNLVTNKWFLERMGGRSVWSAWFIRFCAERGLYMLYTNYPGGEALVVNHRETGVNSKGPNSAMLTNIDDKHDFPPLDEIPLYDFHFNEILEDPIILEGRGLYADIFNIVTV